MTLMGNWRHHDYVALPILKGLPDGYCIRTVQFSFSHQAFAFLIEHESFPDVPDGEEIPRGNEPGFAEYETVEIPDSMKRRDDPVIKMRDLTPEEMATLKKELAKHENGRVQYITDTSQIFDELGFREGVAAAIEKEGKGVKPRRFQPLDIGPAPDVSPNPKPQKKGWEFLGAP